MKIINNKYIKNFRYSVIVVSIIFLAGIIFIDRPFLKLVVFSLSILAISLAVFFKYREFETCAEYISFKKYSFFHTGDIRPYIEIPKIHILDYSAKNIFHIYYLSIMLEPDHVKPKILTISMIGFSEKDIIAIVKIFENIKKQNRDNIEKHFRSLLLAYNEWEAEHEK
ncbi:MAG: hypothetical protein K0R36_835 [Chryseobacterium sp.]|jgi:hypothetical protein|nr:hypothetical protein [Chryseobacterium sp.]